MKTKLYLLACLVCFSLTATAYSGPTILLHHKGNVTVFETDTLQPIIDAAVDGDTIYLTKGVFFSGNKNEYTSTVDSPVVINKSITLKGASGNSSVIGKAGMVIEPREDLEADLYNVLIEGIYITNTMQIKVSNVTLKNCRIYEGCYIGHTGIDAEGKSTSNIKMEKCSIGYFSGYGNKGICLYQDVKDITCVNSLIRDIEYSTNEYGEGISGTFINSSIVQYSPYRGFPSTFVFVNSIIQMPYTSECTKATYSYSLGTFSNSLTYNYKDHCYTTLDDEDKEVIILREGTDEKWADVDFLTENGFLGNDGTVVGPMGGKHPFTLEPELPVVTESSTKLDLANKKFNVNLTVSPKP